MHIIFIYNPYVPNISLLLVTLHYHFRDTIGSRGSKVSQTKVSDNVLDTDRELGWYNIYIH